MQTGRSLRFGLIGGLAAIASALAPSAQAQYAPVPEPRVLQAPPSGPPVAEPAAQEPAEDAAPPASLAGDAAPPSAAAVMEPPPTPETPSQGYAPTPPPQLLASPEPSPPPPVDAPPPVTADLAPSPPAQRQTYAPPPTAGVTQTPLTADVAPPPVQPQLQPSTPPPQAYAPPQGATPAPVAPPPAMPPAPPATAASRPPAAAAPGDAPLRTAPQGGWAAPGALAAPTRSPATAARAALPSPAPARATGGPPTPRQLVLLRRYLALINFYRTMDESMSNLGAAMVASFGRDLPAETQNAILQATGESVRINYPKMMAETEVAMAGVLSLEELEAAVAFYESPVGRSVTSKMSQLTPIVAAQTRRWLPIFQADIERRLCARVACTPTAGRGPPGG